MASNTKPWDTDEDGPLPSEEELFLSDVEAFRAKSRDIIEHHMKRDPIRGPILFRHMKACFDIASFPESKSLVIKIAQCPMLPEITFKGDLEDVLTGLQCMLINVEMPWDYQFRLLIVTTALEQALADHPATLN